MRLGLTKAVSVAMALTYSFQACCGDWIDPDSPTDAMSTNSLVDGRPFKLVFSDEFEVPGRTFDDGHDPRWTALHKNDYTNTALQFYDKGKVKTSGGCLNITTTTEDTSFLAQNDRTLKYSKVKKHYKSGMVQSWNKFCFTGGIIEVRAKLPGEAYVGGLWPAIWLLGNLARATYIGSSTWVWPWSFDSCDPVLQPKQLINHCEPNPHYGMAPHQGRGAPEMDILEAMPGLAALPPSKVGKPYFSTSLQIAPGVANVRPGSGGPPAPGVWYEGLEYGPNSSQNIFFYGTLNEHITREGQVVEKYTYQSDAVSSNTQLNAALWATFHNFRFEWELPASAAAAAAAQEEDEEDDASSSESREKRKIEKGYVRWFMDDELMYGITGKSLDDKMRGSQIPSEPQYILLNTAMSSSWGFPVPCPANCKCDCFDCKDPACACAISRGFCQTLPAHFLIDHVRVWQRAQDSHQKVGCSTPERPSSRWIEGHVDWYKDDWDKEPLQSIAIGGAPCQSNSECGASSPSSSFSSSSMSSPQGEESSGSRGVCASSASSSSFSWWVRPWSSDAVAPSNHPSASVCVCGGGGRFLGPRCLASQGSDPVVWETPQTLGFTSPAWSTALGVAAAVFLGSCCLVLGCRVRKLRREAVGVVADPLLRLSRSPALSLRRTDLQGNRRQQQRQPGRSAHDASHQQEEEEEEEEERLGFSVLEQLGLVRNRSSSMEMAPIASRRQGGAKSYSLVPARSETHLSDIPLGLDS